MLPSTKKGETRLDIVSITKHRQQFLLSPFTKAIKAQNGITHWEQVTCAGYNPYYQRLEAVVSIKQPTGYSGGLCTTGSMEFLRYFVDFHDGAGFQDMGISNFKVADISDLPAGPQHPLSYSSFLFIDDSKHRKFLSCEKAVIPTLRVILSWNSVPNANPNQSVTFGNALDADIQLARKPFILWSDLIQIQNKFEFSNLIDPNFSLPLKEPAVENLVNIFKQYTSDEVPNNRTFYSAVGAKLNSTYDFSKASSLFDISNFDSFNFNFDLFDEFFNNPTKKADVSFEEVTCVGLNTQSDRLSAIIHIKKSSGFSGNLCTKGSREHVAFWADWNNDGIFDQYLGTVSLTVHDIVNIPKGGLFYSVQMPIDVKNRLRRCSDPNIIRIRAVLSWESLPSTTDPNDLNHWGNSKDVLVQIRPAFRPGSGLHSAIYYVGGVDRTAIDSVTHLYNAGAASIYTNRPWGGGISFHGLIDRNGFNGVVKYRFLWKKQTDPDSSYMPVSTSETFSLDDIFTLAGPFADPQTDPNGWYEYKQNPNIGLYNINNYLATWNATTMPDGAYTIRFVHTDEFNNEIVADQFVIMVCNTHMSVSPTANISVDFSKELDLVIDGGDCHSYSANDPNIAGHLRAIHPYFAWWALELQPTSHTNGAVPSPNTRSHSAIGDNGDSNAFWSLDTSPLDPCGYTVSLSAHSRVILNSSPGYFPYYGPKAVGFAKLP